MAIAMSDIERVRRVFAAHSATHQLVANSSSSAPSCPHADTLEVLVPLELRDDPTDELLGLFDAGRAFEDRVLDKQEAALTAAGIGIVDLRSDDRSTEAKRARLEATLEALADPDVQVILGGRLPAMDVPSVVSEKISAHLDAVSQSLGCEPGCPVCAEAPDEFAVMGEPDLLVRDQHGGWFAADVKHAAALRPSKQAARLLFSTIENPTRLVEYQYAGFDDAPLGTPKEQHTFQGQMYYWILDALGIAGRPLFGVLASDERIWWRNLDERLFDRKSKTAQELLANRLAEREGRLLKARHTADLGLPMATRPGKSGQCADCPFRSVCTDELDRLEDLTLVPGIGPATRDSLLIAARRVGRQPSLTGFATIDDDRLEELVASAYAVGNGIARIPGPPTMEGRIHWLVDQARTQVEPSSATPPRAFLRRDVTPELWSKVLRVMAASTRFYFDLESSTLPGHLPQGLVYMIGATTDRPAKKGGRTQRFDPYWIDGRTVTSTPLVVTDTELSDAQIAELLAAQDKMVKKVVDRMLRLNEQAQGRFKAFVYSNAERSVLTPIMDRLYGERLAREWFTPRNPDRPETAKVVDLHAVIKRYIHLPLPDLKLKTVAPFMGHAWADENPSGLASVQWAEIAFSDPDPDIRQEYRNRIAQYNKDDTEALIRVLHWLRHHRIDPVQTGPKRYKLLRATQYLR